MKLNEGKRQTLGPWKNNVETLILFVVCLDYMVISYIGNWHISGQIERETLLKLKINAGVWKDFRFKNHPSLKNIHFVTPDILVRWNKPSQDDIKLNWCACCTVSSLFPIMVETRYIEFQRTKKLSTSTHYQHCYNGKITQRNKLWIG